MLFIRFIFRKIGFFILIIRTVRLFKRAVTYAFIAVPVMRRAANRTVYHVVVFKKIGVANAASKFLFAHLSITSAVLSKIKEKYSSP